MSLLLLLVLVSGLHPLIAAWRSQRRTSLAHAVGWASLAWLAWVVVLALAVSSSNPVTGGRYVGLCLIACAGVAVLGARRPGVVAWNFVIVGLLAVLLLPCLEGFLTGATVELGGVRAVFLAAALVLVVVNYLPTRLAPAALLLAIGCGLELTALLAPVEKDSGTILAKPGIASLLLALVPWAAWASWCRRPTVSAFDALWRDFRDRYGLVWAQRVREQFNRAAVHAGWEVELGWHGLQPIDEATQPDAAMQEACRATLRSLLKRFGLLENDPN